jgi:hypothetical protein
MARKYFDLNAEKKKNYRASKREREERRGKRKGRIEREREREKEREKECVLLVMPGASEWEEANTAAAIARTHTTHTAFIILPSLLCVCFFCCVSHSSRKSN